MLETDGGVREQAWPHRLRAALTGYPWGPGPCTRPRGTAQTRHLLAHTHTRPRAALTGPQSRGHSARGRQGRGKGSLPPQGLLPPSGEGLSPDNKLLPKKKQDLFMVSLCPQLWCGAHTSITAVSGVETPMQPQQPGKIP